jgi:hypothetical protein
MVLKGSAVFIILVLVSGLVPFSQIPFVSAQLSDTDGDGIPNDFDNCKFDFNPDQIDTDGDGFGDVCQIGDPDDDGIQNRFDNCRFKPNPSQEDTDSDTVGDACEDINNNNDLDDDDTDRDTLPNYKDTDDDNDGVLTSSEDDGDGDLNNDDADSDGIPDWLDATYSPPPSDVDGDGIDDLVDNCYLDFNPAQEDNDEDGIGDVCDLFPFDLFNDGDGDVLGANEDNCPLIFNPTQTDADRDGIGDACETRPTVSIFDVLITDSLLVEGDVGTTIFSFSVILNQPAPFPVTMQFSTLDSTALGGEDYVANSGFVNFDTGEIFKKINVLVNGDRLVEANETFSTFLFNPVGVDILDGVAIGLIINDDNSPLAKDQMIAVTEDTQVPITLAAEDGDLDPLTFTVLTPPAHGTLSGTAPELTYTPDLDFNGDDLFTFKASDGANESNEATVSITVTPVNDAPTANAGEDQSVTENTLVTLDGFGSDVEGDAITFLWTQTAGTPVTLSDVSATNPTFIAPLVGPSGETLTFALTVSDSNGGKTTDTIHIIVNNIESIPPEAYNQFDPITKDVLVYGTDNKDGNLGPIPPASVVTTRWHNEDEDDRSNAELRTYIITDAAENKLILKEIVKKNDKEIKAKVLSIQYNDNPPITPAKNQKSFEWSLDKNGSIKELEQTMKVGKGKSEHKVSAKFDAKKNQTKIKSEKPKLKETLPGLVLLKMNTENGKLVISH